MLRDAFVRLARAAFETARLYPLWVGIGILVAVLLGILLRGPLRKILEPWMARCRPLAFQIACGLLFCVLFLDLVDESLVPSPDATSLAILTGTLLVLALGAQYGQPLLARLKKLGPLELFEKEATELIERLKEVLERLDVEIGEALSTPLSPAAEATYHEAYAFIHHVEFSGTTSASEENKRRFGDMLFKFAQLASIRAESLSRKADWWVARLTLERLQKFLGKEFEGFRVAYNLGRAYVECAAAGPGGDELRRKALDCFAEAAERSPFDSDSYLWLANVQDQLGMLDLAIANNLKALERRHGYASAKYNIVISRIKKGEMAQALADLLAIQPQDDTGEETLRLATTDDELRPLLTHPLYGGQAQWWLELHQDPARIPV
jgi:tetratricopeptide (TPR) repeat protein